LIYRLIKSNYKKYDVSICYSHHHGILSKLTRSESKNNIVFIHTDLLKSRTREQLEKLNKKLLFEKFKKIVCVSECAKESFIELYPNFMGKIVVANNYIDGEDIINRSNDKINEKKDSKVITFINVARHDEVHKKISRIISASKRLNDEGYKFKVILIGKGKDTDLYKSMIKDLKLKNLEILGEKQNPFPYYKISDAFVFSSAFEGYGIVLNEARILGLPIITTDVADASIITKEGYGILCKNDDNGIYYGMKEFMDKGYKIKNKFDYKKFNNNITKVINDIVKE
jgi:glycosyltransferase involved in cell wall biosynthesis